MFKRKNRLWPGATALALAGTLLSQAAARADAAAAQVLAIRLFDRIAGVPIALSDPRLAQMASLIQQGDLLGAADVAAADDSFLNITVKHMFTPMSNRDEDPLQPLNDFVATGIGVVRDDLDARKLLSANFIYKAGSGVDAPSGKPSIQTDVAVYKGNAHYQFLETSLTNLKQNLVQAPQKTFPDTNPASAAVALTDAAGLLTTQAWGAAHLVAGTNRRAIQYAFQEFLCTPIRGWADATVRDERVRRDVDRTPGGNPQTYLNTCKSCHAGMDALGGAYAYFDYVPDDNGDMFVSYLQGQVVSKMNKNNRVYPAGFVTQDDSWMNQSTQGLNASFGWSGNLSGNGANALGKMLASTQAFPLCMAKRVFTEVCKRPPGSTEASVLQTLASDFQGNGYKLKRLFEKAAILPECLGM